MSGLKLCPFCKKKMMPTCRSKDGDVLCWQCGAIVPIESWNDRPTESEAYRQGLERAAEIAFKYCAEHIAGVAFDYKDGATKMATEIVAAIRKEIDDDKI